MISVVEASSPLGGEGLNFPLWLFRMHACLLNPDVCGLITHGMMLGHEWCWETLLLFWIQTKYPVGSVSRNGVEFVSNLLVTTLNVGAFVKL